RSGGTSRASRTEVSSEPSGDPLSAALSNHIDARMSRWGGGGALAPLAGKSTTCGASTSTRDSLTADVGPLDSLADRRRDVPPTPTADLLPSQRFHRHNANPREWHLACVLGDRFTRRHARLRTTSRKNTLTGPQPGPKKE